MRGPIDYIIVGFEGNNFDGSILKALGEAIDKGIIGLVSLAVVSKDSTGSVTELDIVSADDNHLAIFAKKYAAKAQRATYDDIHEMVGLLQNNTAAGLLVIEHLWAKPLKQAIINANGVLVAEGRIHPDAAEELNQTSSNKSKKGGK